MKDPAILWYWNDWGGGTRTLSRHLKGCYIDLLEAQFNSGHLSLEEIRTVLGQDQANWTVLSKKFKQDENGLFYNERMEIEINKRKEFSNKQKKRIQDYWDKKKHENDSVEIPRNNHGKTTVLPLENEIENEIGNINDNLISSEEELKGSTGSKKAEKPLWKTDFKTYQDELREAWKKIITPKYVSEREKYHPNLDIIKTLEKACVDYWSTEAGWKKKKAAKINEIDWVATFNNALTQKMNQVWKQRSNLM